MFPRSRCHEDICEIYNFRRVANFSRVGMSAFAVTCFDQLLSEVVDRPSSEVVGLFAGALSFNVPDPLVVTGKIRNGFRDRHDTNFSFPALGLLKISQGEVLNTGVVLDPNSGTFIASSQQFDAAQIQNFSYTPKSRHSVRLDHVVPLLRPGDQIYGHWLVDILPRVWLTLGCVDIRKLKFLVKHNVPAYALKLMELLGIPSKNIYRWKPENNTEALSASNIYLPSNLRYQQFVHPLFASFADYLKTKVLGVPFEQAEPSRKLFISRKGWRDKQNNHVRSLLNAEEVEKFFVDRDFEVFFPENHSLAEQARIFAGASVIVGEEGSGLHNSLFMAPGTTVVCLRGEKNHSMIQSTMCRAQGQYIAHIFGEIDDEEDRNRQSSFRIELDAVEKAYTALVASSVV